MANMAGVAAVAIKQPAVGDDAPTHSSGHHHADDITASHCCPTPGFAEHDGFGVVVDECCQTGELSQR